MQKQTEDLGFAYRSKKYRRNYMQALKDLYKDVENEKLEDKQEIESTKEARRG